MTLETLPQGFTVCKVADFTGLDASTPFCFTGRTDTEFSLVCPTQNAPVQTLTREDGWRAFRVAGTMEFALVGVLAELTGLLAKRGIPVFAVSTFDTDYVLVKAEHYRDTLAALEAGGHRITDA